MLVCYAKFVVYSDYSELCALTVVNTNVVVGEILVSLAAFRVEKVEGKSVLGLLCYRNELVCYTEFVVQYDYSKLCALTVINTNVVVGEILVSLVGTILKFVV